MDSPQAKRRRRSNDDEVDTSLSVSKLEKLSPVVVFAHGAGAPSSSDWMIRFYFFPLLCRASYVPFIVYLYFQLLLAF